VAAAKAKPTKTKSSSTKNQQTTKNSWSQRSQTSVTSSHSQTSRQVSVSDEEDEEPMHISGILDVDSDHIMEPSDGEGEKGSAHNLMAMSDKSDDDEGENFIRLSPQLSNDKLNSEQK
jgi:hypothetical protein